MNPEELSESEEEEDDEKMLFVFPALYLASIGYETKGTPRHNDAEWICEVLEDDRAQGYEKLRVEPHILLDFSRYVTVEEKIGMFMYMLSRNANFEKLSDRFERSRETIHRHIKACFDAMISVKGDFVKHVSTRTHWKISSDPHCGPYLENCIGAIDGIHAPMTISDREAAPYLNKEGSLTQNVMLACDFDLNFVHVSSHEGSMSDAAVLYSAIESGFQVPGGKYYVLDGGYPNTPCFLAPYSGVPYHTEEQEQRNCQPGDYKELFNLRHAQLRNHIRHAIGILKMRFPILSVATFYRLETQLKIPSAAVVLHNVIQRQGGDHGEFSSNQTVPISTRKIVALPSGDDAYGNDVAALNIQCDTGNALRDDIAEKMWADYIRSM